MNYYFQDFLPIYAFAIAISLIWFGVHFYLKRKDKNWDVLPAKKKEWMVVSKIAGYFFLILPIIAHICVIIDDIFDLFKTVFGYLIGIFIALVVFFPSLIKKGKL